MSGLAGIRHLDLCVRDLKKSLEFYCQLLGPLGWRVSEPHHEIVGEQGEHVIYLGSPAGFYQGAIGLRLAHEKTGPWAEPYNRYQPGLHHLALNAPSRKAVDETWDWIRKTGIEHEGQPRDYYDIPYYAVFFRDPDGIKVEVAHYLEPGEIGYEDSGPSTQVAVESPAIA